MTPQVPRQLAALLGKERCRALAERTEARMREDLEVRLGVPHRVVEESLAAALEALARAGTEYGDPLDEATDAELDDRVRAHAWLAVRDRTRSRSEIPRATVAERRLFETVFAIFRGVIDDDGPTAFSPYELAATVEALQPPSYRRILWLDVLAGGRVDPATAARCLDVSAGEVEGLRGRARAAFAQSLVESFDELHHAAPPELDERPRDPLTFCVGMALALTEEVPRAVEPDLDDASWRLQPGEPIAAPADPNIAAAVESARRALEEVRSVDEEVRIELDRSHAETFERDVSRRAVASAVDAHAVMAPSQSSDFSSLRLDVSGDEDRTASVASSSGSTTADARASEPDSFPQDEGEWPPFRLPAAMRSVADEEWKRSLEAAAEASDDDESDAEDEFRLPWHLQGGDALGFDDDTAFDWPAFALPARRVSSEYDGLRVGALDLDESDGRADRELEDGVDPPKVERSPLEGPDADRFRRYLAETGAPPMLESRFDEPARARSKRAERDDRRSKARTPKGDDSKRAGTSESRRRKERTRTRTPMPESAEAGESTKLDVAPSVEARSDRPERIDNRERDEPTTIRPIVEETIRLEDRTAFVSSSEDDGLRLPPSLVDDDLKCELKPERKSLRERRRAKTPTPRGEAPPISARPVPPSVRPAPPAPWMPPDVERDVAASHRPAPIPWTPPPVERDADSPRPPMARTSSPWTPPPLPAEELRAPAPAPRVAPPTNEAPVPRAEPSAPQATSPATSPAAELPQTTSRAMPGDTHEPRDSQPRDDEPRETAQPAPASRESARETAPRTAPSDSPQARLSVAPPPADAGRAVEWTAPAPATGFPDGKPAVVRGAEIPAPKTRDDARSLEPGAAAGGVDVPPAGATEAAPSASPQPQATVFRAVFRTSGPGVAGPAVPQQVHVQHSPEDADSATPANVVDIPVVSGAYSASDPAATRDDDSDSPPPLTLPAHMAYPESYDPYAPRPVNRVSVPDDEPESAETAAPRDEADDSRPNVTEGAESATDEVPSESEVAPPQSKATESKRDDRETDSDDEAKKPVSDPLRSSDRKTISSTESGGDRRRDALPTPRDSDEPFWLTAKRDRGTSQRERGADDSGDASKVAFEMPRPTPAHDLPRRGPLHESRRERPGILRLLKAKVAELMHPGQKAQRERAEVQQRLDAYLGPRAKPRPPVDKGRKADK